jgi:glycosyltransferase involved in cell wall biosynthesis
VGKRAKNLFVIGYVPERNPGKPYNLVRLFVYPLLFEGFGLLPLESMTCACPGLASDVSRLPEVCSDAAFYADPQDANSISGAILQVLFDEYLRNSLIQKGFDRASTFSWEKSALSHLKVFEEVFSP